MKLFIHPLKMLAAAAVLAAVPAAAAPQTLRVAAVQSDSAVGEAAHNLAAAEILVQKAAQDGAVLILLPELMPSGYALTQAVWDAAEPAQGATHQWLADLSQRLGVWLGTSFIEADGPDFFNTFVLIAPDGTVAGRVRKQWPAGFENFFTRGDAGPHTFDTDLGKIGVAICFEATLCRIMRSLHEEAVDLVLLPTADPVVEAEAQKDPVDWEHDLRETAALYARTLGVPAVLANQGGAWQTALPWPLPAQDAIFRGQSAIAAAGGTVVQSLGQDPGYIVADVELDPSRKNPDTPWCTGRYCKEMPAASRVAQAVAEVLGRLWYVASPERRQRACAVSGACGQ